MSVELSQKITDSHVLLYKFSKKIDEAAQNPKSADLKKRVNTSFERFMDFYGTEIAEIKKEANASGSPKLQFKTNLLQQRTEIVHKKLAHFLAKNFDTVKEIKKEEKTFLEFEKQFTSHSQPKAKGNSAQKTEQEREEKAKTFAESFTKGAQTAADAKAAAEKAKNEETLKGFNKGVNNAKAKAAKARAKAAKANLEKALKNADSKAKTTFCPWNKANPIIEQLLANIDVEANFKKLPKIVQFKINADYPEATTGLELALALLQNNQKAEYKDFIRFAKEHKTLSKKELKKLDERYPYKKPVQDDIRKQIKKMEAKGNKDAQKFLQTGKWNGSVIAEAAERSRNDFNKRLQKTEKAMLEAIEQLIKMKNDPLLAKPFQQKQTHAKLGQMLQKIIPLWENVNASDLEFNGDEKAFDAKIEKCKAFKRMRFMDVFLVLCQILDKKA